MHAGANPKSHNTRQFVFNSASDLYDPRNAVKQRLCALAEDRGLRTWPEGYGSESLMGDLID